MLWFLLWWWTYAFVRGMSNNWPSHLLLPSHQSWYCAPPLCSPLSSSLPQFFPTWDQRLNSSIHASNKGPYRSPSTRGRRLGAHPPWYWNGIFWLWAYVSQPQATKGKVPKFSSQVLTFSIVSISWTTEKKRLRALEGRQVNSTIHFKNPPHLHLRWRFAQHPPSFYCLPVPWIRKWIPQKP